MNKIIWSLMTILALTAIPTRACFASNLLLCPDFDSQAVGELSASTSPWNGSGQLFQHDAGHWVTYSVWVSTGWFGQGYWDTRQYWQPVMVTDARSLTQVIDSGDGNKYSQLNFANYGGHGYDLTAALWQRVPGIVGGSTYFADGDFSGSYYEYRTHGSFVVDWLDSNGNIISSSSGLERYYYAYYGQPRSGIDTFIAPENALSADFRFVGNMTGGYGGNINMDNLEFYTDTVVPEPTTMVLFGLGVAGMGIIKRRKAAKRA